MKAESSLDEWFIALIWLSVLIAIFYIGLGGGFYTPDHEAVWRGTDHVPGQPITHPPIAQVFLVNTTVQPTAPQKEESK